MAVAFTKEQQQAVELHGRNILVSAAAGSGKTAVLVERIIRMIMDETEKTDIDRLLVVTFTNAAAAEMRERIGRAIDRKLEEEPENVHLQKQAALLPRAQITTIDSFCLFVIHNHFNEIGLDPGFSIADEGELKLLKQDVLTELLEQKYEEKDEDFLNCVEYFTGGSSDRQLEEYIQKLYEFSMSNPWPEEWLEKRKKDYKITDVTQIEKSDWCRYLEDYIRSCVSDCTVRLSQAISLALRPEGPYFYEELLSKEREMLTKISEAEDFSAMARGFDGVLFGRLPSKKDDSVDVGIRESVKQMRTEVKKQIETMRDTYFCFSLEQILERMKLAEKPVETLMELVLSFKRRLDEKKREENRIDFHDMEHFALDILVERNKETGAEETTAAAKEYRQFFQEILIDEYQDSNLVQELILRSISGEEENRFNRFMVGDVKQSIYKFRLARPELFIEKYSCYSKEDSQRQRIDLHKNFRSRKEVIDSVNFFFSRIMQKSLGGISYDEDAALYQGAVYPENSGNETEIMLFEKDGQSPLSAREQEALLIAGRIKRLMREFSVTDKESGKLRPVRYGDIVVLLRSTREWAEDFKGIFEKEGIPAYVAARTGYFQAAEVRELLQLLHVLNNPLQDIPLFGVMTSFFGGFSEEEMAYIRGNSKNESYLYENLLVFEADEKIKSKINKLIKQIETWRAMSVYTPIHKLLQEILSSTGYLEYVTAKPGGEQRQANVEMLLVKAASFEKTSYYGLFHFLRYIEQLEKYQVDYGEADILDENADVVRIMSIHKSKGLEFPICFLAGLSKKFNRRDVSGRLLADVDMGLGVDYIDSLRRVQAGTLRKSAIASKLKLDDLAEELRVFYVAMTRAKEKLILTAAVSDSGKLREKLLMERAFCQHREAETKVPFFVLASASSYLDFLLPCVNAEEIIWVSSEEIMASEVEETIRVNDLKQTLLLSQPDNEMMTTVSQKFERTYPFEYLSNLFVKITVSELKMAAIAHLSDKSIGGLEEADTEGISEAYSAPLFEEQEVVPYIPSFVIKEKGEMGGAARGSAYHRVMELLDMKAIALLEEGKGQTTAHAAFDSRLQQELLRQIGEMAAKEKLSPEWKEAVAAEKLAVFFNTSLAGRMLKAAAEDKLYREKPFVLGLPASRLGEDFPESETVLIQGIIDVFFEEDEGIVVADYKTDSVKEAGELVQRYQVQLDYYAEALQRLTGKPVTEKIIYSFCLSKEIRL